MVEFACRKYDPCELCCAQTSYSDLTWLLAKRGYHQPGRTEIYLAAREKLGVGVGGESACLSNDALQRPAQLQICVLKFCFPTFSSDHKQHCCVSTHDATSIGR